MSSGTDRGRSVEIIRSTFHSRFVVKYVEPLFNH